MIDMSELIFTEHHTVLIDDIIKQNEMMNQLYLSTKIYESIFYCSDDDDEKIKEKIKNVYYLFVNWLFQNNVFLILNMIIQMNLITFFVVQSFLIKLMKIQLITFIRTF